MLTVALVACVMSEWWFTPPVRISADDRLGFSEAQILSMGFERWSAKVYEVCNSDRRTDSMACGVDGSVLVFASCLRSRNDRLIKGLSRSRSTAFLSLRQSLFEYGMSAIALEDCLAGGGTYSIHSPRYMWRDEEEVLYRVLLDLAWRKAENPKVRVSDVWRRFRNLQKQPTGLVGKAAPLSEIHRWARSAQRAAAEIDLLSKGWSWRRRNALENFMKDWANYLSVRGADKI